MLWVAMLCGCWREDDFRARCLAADRPESPTCPVPTPDVGVDAGVSLRRWSDVAALLFDVPDAVDAGFDVSFVPARIAVSAIDGGCSFAGGVLTAEGSVVCIPSSANQVSEYLSDGGVQLLSSLNLRGAGWRGGVLDDDGVVVGLPVEGAELFRVLRPASDGRRNYDLLPLGLGGGAAFTGGALTTEGALVAVGPRAVSFYRLGDGGLTQVSTGVVDGGSYAGAVLSPSGRSVLLVPRTASTVLEASLRTFNTSDRATPRGELSGYAGGVLLASGDALLIPAFPDVPFARVPADGGIATRVVGPNARASFFSAAWSTNGYAYSVETDGGLGEVLVINRRGEVAFSRLPATDGGFFARSHLGLVGMPDGRLVSCGCQAPTLMVLTPRHKRVVPVEVMASPWLNKW